MPKTLDEIRRTGLEALRERLGKAGMIRFLQQFHAGDGDSAAERHDWVDRTTLDDLRSLAEKNPTKRSRRTRSSRNGR